MFHTKYFLVEVYNSSIFVYMQLAIGCKHAVGGADILRMASVARCSLPTKHYVQVRRFVHSL